MLVLVVVKVRVRVLVVAVRRHEVVLNVLIVESVLPFILRKLEGWGLSVSLSLGVLTDL